MGRIFEALQRSSANARPEPHVTQLGVSSALIGSIVSDTADLERVRRLTPKPTPEHRLVTLGGERSVGAERIRILAAQLRHLQDQRKIKKLLITSAVKDEGKTVLSANIAISLARTRQRVVLVDGDFHQASAARLLSAKGWEGLTDWWRSERAVQDYLARISGLPLWFLPAGSPVDQPLEILQSERLSDLMAEMSNWFDWVVIDSPPSAPLADASVWAKMADGILLVTREGKTPKRLLRKVLDSLDTTKLLGAVLNDCSDPDQQYYSHYYNFPKKQ